jgi:hypothetical protein
MRLILRIAVREARNAIKRDPRGMQNVIFLLLTMLLEHEADKADEAASQRRPSDPRP